MKIRIIKLKRLNRAQTRAAAALINCCNSHDGTHYGFPFDADGYYLLYEGGKLAAVSVLFLMGEHLNCKRIYELAAFTLPERRRRAYFSRLIAAMKAKAVDSFIRYAVYLNASAVMTLKARGAEHSHDELMLKTELGGLQHIDAAADTARLESIVSRDEQTSAKHELLNNSRPESSYIRITEDAVDTDEDSDPDTASCVSGHASSEFGECYFRTDGLSQNAYIFGVQTYANYLRQGHAYKLLSVLFSELEHRGVKSVSLQVSSENTPALRLYEKLGMKEIERLSLYIEQL